MRKTTTAIAAILCLGTIGSAATAATDARRPDFTFRFDSRELVTAEGTAREYARLKKRIESYCDEPGKRGLSAWTAERSCRAVVLAECEAQMPQTLLAFHLAETEKRA